MYKNDNKDNGDNKDIHPDFLHQVEIHLAVTTKIANKAAFVTCDGFDYVVPYCLKGLSLEPSEVAERLFEQMTGTRVRPWFLLKQICAIEKLGNVVILYSVVMEEPVDLGYEFQWVGFDEICKNTDTLKEYSLSVQYDKP